MCDEYLNSKEKSNQNWIKVKLQEENPWHLIKLYFIY